MTSLAKYGQALAATTAAIQELVAASTGGVPVTARTPDTARVGVSGASINVFLYRDELVSYRDGSDPGSVRHLGAELRYLISAHPADAADANSASQVAYGGARAAVERNPLLSLPDEVKGGVGTEVTLVSTALTFEESTAIWLAGGAPMRLAFSVTARLALRDGPDPVVAIADIVRMAGPGVIVAFSGPDAAAKAAAASSVAAELGQPLVKVQLARIVSKYIGETDLNLQKLFATAEGGGAVLFLDEADALYGRRADTGGGLGRYPEITGEQVLGLLARAPGLVIIALRGTVGELLAKRSASEVQFAAEG